ncbi:MAG: hypothetical protein WBQ89_22600, partial [Candidatus Acidiferrum sp.]
MRFGRICDVLGVILAAAAIVSPCSAQKPSSPVPKPPLKTTNVTVIDVNGEQITRLEIDLRDDGNYMEPVAEPRRIRVDDRSNVQFFLKNLSPMDVCARTASPPTPTVETPVGESIVPTIAGLGAMAIGTSTQALMARSTANNNLAAGNVNTIMELNKEFAKPVNPQCRVQADSEYRRILDVSKDFFNDARNLIGTATASGACRGDHTDQVELACEIDTANRQLTNYANADYRGKKQENFSVDGNSALQPIRDAYTVPLASIQNAGTLQSMVDEMAAWAQDLHKKYDYSATPTDASSTTAPPIIPGVFTVSPTALSLSPNNPPQSVLLVAGAQPGAFTATPSSDTGWLMLSKAGSSPTSTTFVDTAPSSGAFALLITIDSTHLTSASHNGSITISGTSAARGTTIVNVTLKPPSSPSDCDLDRLRKIDDLVDQAKALMLLLSDNNKTLETAQTTLKTNYMALAKVADDFARRKAQHIVDVNSDGVLVQQFNLGTDRKDTSTGYISCISDLDGKTATTTNINYSILYQDFPHWSASAGFLTSFLEKKIIGIANENVPGSSPPANMQLFGITDRAQVQFIPMAYVNYRILPYKSTRYGKGKEDELIWTVHLSGGFGVNPNSGSNQPEFFAGFAIGLNRFMFHPGVDFGRTQSLAGGYALNSPVPAGLTTAPINWSYHPAFSIG